MHFCKACVIIRNNHPILRMHYRPQALYESACVLLQWPSGVWGWAVTVSLDTAVFLWVISYSSVRQRLLPEVHDVVGSSPTRSGLSWPVAQWAERMIIVRCRPFLCMWWYICFVSSDTLPLFWSFYAAAQTTVTSLVYVGSIPSCSFGNRQSVAAYSRHINDIYPVFSDTVLCLVIPHSSADNGYFVF